MAVAAFGELPGCIDAMWYSSSFKFVYMQRMLLCAVILLCMHSLCWGRDRALVIGVSQYQAVTGLKYADADAKQFSQLLINFAQYSPNDVTLVTNQEATKKRIEEEIAKVIKESKKKPFDNFVFMFAGHGLEGVLTGSNAQQKIEVRNTDIFLAPYDASLDQNDFYSSGEGGQVRNQTFIEKAWLARQLSQVRAKSAIIILDSCFSGTQTFGALFVENQKYRVVGLGAEGNLTGVTDLPQKAGNAGDLVEKVAYLAASAGDQYAAEYDELGHGALSYCIITYINAIRRGMEVSQQRKISISELYSDIQRTFKEKTIKGRTLESAHKPLLVPIPSFANMNELVFMTVEGVRPQVSAFVASTPVSGRVNGPASGAPVAAPLAPQPSPAMPSTVSPSRPQMPQTTSVAAVQTPQAPVPATATAVASAPPQTGPVTGPSAPAPVLQPIPPSAAPVMAQTVSPQPTPGTSSAVSATSGQNAPAQAPVTVVQAVPPVPAAPAPAAVAPPQQLPAPAPVAMVPATPQTTVATVEQRPSVAGEVVQLAPPSGLLSLRTEPQGMQIHIDGIKHAQTSDADLILFEGRHVVELFMPATGYRESFVVNIKKLKPVYINLVARGRLEIASYFKKNNEIYAGPPLEVQLDGKPVGNMSKLEFAQLLAGTHRIDVKYKDETKSRNIEIRPGSPLLIKYTVIDNRKEKLPIDGVIIN